MIENRKIALILFVLVAALVGVVVIISLLGDWPKSRQPLIGSTSSRSPETSPAHAAINLGDPSSSLNLAIQCHGNPSGTPFGHLDAVEAKAKGAVEVVGWAFDEDDLSNSVHVHIYIDGRAGSGARHVDAGLASALRPDVATAHPNIALADRHGFRYRINGLANGPHTFWAYAINVSGRGENCLIGVQAT
jgi:hypothetical protein